MKNRLTTIAATTVALVLIASAAFAAGQRFSDVSPSHAHAQGIEWAASEGIVSGYSDGTFRPEQAVTRGQLATILHRYDAQQATTPEGSAADFHAWFRCWEGSLAPLPPELDTTEAIDAYVAENLPADCS